MKHKKPLIVLAIVLAVCFICSLCFVVGALILNAADNDNEDDQTQDETQDESQAEEDKPNVTSDTLFFVANCNLYRVENGQAQEIDFDNDTDVECFDKKVFRGRYTTIAPEYNSLINLEGTEYNLYLLDTQELEVSEIKYESESTLTAAFNLTNNKLYTYQSGEDGGVYEGTVQSPTAKRIFAVNTVIYGRGGVIYDDYALRISPDGNKIIIVDTFSSVNKNGTDHQTLKIIDTNGQLLYSAKGTFGKWIDNSRIIYSKIPDTAVASKTMVIDLQSKQETEIKIGPAYNYDTASDKILVNYFEKEEDYKVAKLNVAIYSAQDLSLQRTITGKNIAFAQILDADNIIAKSVFDCSGDPTTEDVKYPCPMDGVFYFYEDKVVTLNKNNEIKTLVKFDDPTSPRWID